MDQFGSGKEKDPAHVQTGLGGTRLLDLAQPYLKDLDPVRTSAIFSALQRLQILQREGIVLGMPEIVP